jgi:hypothetical protein
MQELVELKSQRVAGPEDAELEKLIDARNSKTATQLQRLHLKKRLT